MEIITATELQKKFDLTIQNNSLRNSKIKNEIEAIEKYVYIFPAQINTFKKQPIKIIIDQTPQIFDLGHTYIYRNIFHDAFHKYLNSEEKTFIEKLHNESEETHYLKQRSANQAIELFAYYKWLNELLNPSKKAEKKDSLFHKDKMLALYYLGLDMRKFQNNVQSAKILAKILDLDYTNTKDYLTYFDGKDCKVKTKENIEKMLDLFESETFTSIQESVKKDLGK